jgi:hypothetical protein
VRIIEQRIKDPEDPPTEQGMLLCEGTAPFPHKVLVTGAEVGPDKWAYPMLTGHTLIDWVEFMS